VVSPGRASRSSSICRRPVALQSFHPAASGRRAIDTSELNFEAIIEDALLRGGYRHRRPDHFDRHLCLDPDVLFEFLDATQPQTLEKLRAQYLGGEHRSALLRRISTRIARDGAVHVLRRGVSDRGCSFHLAYFRPETHQPATAVENHDSIGSPGVVREADRGVSRRCHA
jgi:hypothetical protein